MRHEDKIKETQRNQSANLAPKVKFPLLPFGNIQVTFLNAIIVIASITTRELHQMMQVRPFQLKVEELTCTK